MSNLPAGNTVQVTGAVDIETMAEAAARGSGLYPFNARMPPGELR
jgi:hypothetical protein